MRKTYHMLILACTLFINSELRAEVYNVPNDYKTIQSAIDASRNGDVIEVSPGTYLENVNFNQREIILKSTHGASQTIIDGRRLGPVVSISGGGRNTGVFGFTVQNGSSSSSSGGINVFFAASAIVENIIQNNEGVNGNGIFLQSASALVKDNLIRLNRVNPGISGGSGGGGIGVTGNWCIGEFCGNTIDRNVIEYNSAVGLSNGGAVYGTSCSTLTITNNLMRSNRAPNSGGAIFTVNGCRAHIENNVFIDNVAGFAAGFGVGGAIYLGGSNPGSLIFNNTFIRNSAGVANTIKLGFSDQFANNIVVNSDNTNSVECVQLQGTNLNIIRNNMFANANAFSQSCGSTINVLGNIVASPVFFSGSFKLAPSSSGIDLGDNLFSTLNLDASGAQRIVDGDDNNIPTVDLGAYEYQGGFRDGFEELDRP
jgi:predicted outer membrane repeat protein